MPTRPCTWATSPGAYLPPDIFARYHRLRGNDVLMVSGSDTHGTPITVTAEQEGIEPGEVVERYHRSFVESFLGLGISFDLFTHTDTENHWAVTTDFFLRLLEKGLHLQRDHARRSTASSASASWPTAMSRAPAPSAALRTRAATSATTAASRSTRWS